MVKNLCGMFVIGTLAFGVTACSESPSPVAPTPAGVASGQSVVPSQQDAVAGQAAGAKPGTMTIVGIVLQEDGEFDVLQAAVVRAGLVEVLNGSRQFTVFAPTDAAFVATLAVADEAAALAVVNGLDVDVLKNILLYHVIEGRRTSTSVLAAPSLRMLNGATLTRTKLTTAGIATADIAASNGVVHVINRVLMP
jgi:uncharacterized surface protein with fasciclin (FAS1) repeats